MKLTSGHIYAAQPLISNGTTYPTVTISGTATVYVSNSKFKPESLLEMTADSGFHAGINVIIGQVKWIAFSFASGLVEENGLVKAAQTGFTN